MSGFCRTRMVKGGVLCPLRVPRSSRLSVEKHFIREESEVEIR